MRASPFPPRRLRYVVVLMLLICVVVYLSPTRRYIRDTDVLATPEIPEQNGSSAEENAPTPEEDRGKEDPDTVKVTEPSPVVVTKPATISLANAAPLATGFHPIDSQIRLADRQFAKMLAKESHTLQDAAVAYRARRGRHPPPGFDKWYEFAKANDALVIEEFWDRIYHDLEPFWGMDPADIRREASAYEMTIRVRAGNATSGSDWFWTKIWLNMIQTIEHLLPDMDIALNAMDEPRIVVPWEEISGYMAKAAKTRNMPDARSVVNDYQYLGPYKKEDDDKDRPRTTWENTKPYWKVAVRGCPPDSLARKAEIQTDFSKRPSISSETAQAHMTDGYVSNFSLSTEFCHQPDLQGLNGIFVEPLSVSATAKMFPLFGGSKLAVNNEILLPAPMYWNEEERFTGGSAIPMAWGEKKAQAIWRGVATGGKNRENNWRAFQRHRFVAMNNATTLTRAEAGTDAPPNFALPKEGEYELAAQEDGRLGEWVGSWANASFIDLMCANKVPKKVTCNYTSPHFAITKGLKMKNQFAYKYLPDIDGNSFSGRYLGFLRSTSLPIKATVWHEWHDSRLVAWKHFVPMDSRFSDWYGIMQYFLGYSRPPTAEHVYNHVVQGHDQIAEKLATAGKQWAEKVLRPEDMQIYTLRLLLEYARICDEKRESMGWVDDLLATPKQPST